jgi:hypothetical protein
MQSSAEPAAPEPAKTKLPSLTASYLFRDADFIKKAPQAFSNPAPKTIDKDTLKLPHGAILVKG